jgi:hypothetical protein
MYMMKFFKPNIDKMQQKKDAKGLIEVIRYYNKNLYNSKTPKENLEIQRKAKNALQELGAIAIHPLIQEFLTEESNIRDIALDILRSIGNSAAIAPLEKYLESHLIEDYWHDTEVYTALVFCGWKPKNIEMQIKHDILNYHDIDNLHKKYGALAVNVLMTAIEDVNGYVSKIYKAKYYGKWQYRGWKGIYCEQLGKIGDEKAIGTIAKVLYSNQDRNDAIKALVEINSDKATQSLVELLLNSPSHTPISDRQYLFKVLKEIGHTLDYKEIYCQLQSTFSSKNMVDMPQQQLDLQQNEISSYGTIQVLGLDEIEHRGHFRELQKLYQDKSIQGEKICQACGRLSVVPAHGSKMLPKIMSDEYRNDEIYSLCLFCGNFSSAIWTT